MRTAGPAALLDAVPRARGHRAPARRPLLRVLRRRAAFAAIADEEPATFYLTDFLARNFDTARDRGLGLDRHPELLPAYFGNYRRLVYLAQTDDPALTARPSAARRPARACASSAAATGYGELATDHRDDRGSPAGVV